MYVKCIKSTGYNCASLNVIAGEVYKVDEKYESIQGGARISIINEHGDAIEYLASMFISIKTRS